MTNIGKQRILLPKDIEVEAYGWLLCVKGRCGKGEILFPEQSQIKVEKKYVSFFCPGLDAASYGSLQKKLKSFIYGISRKYVQKLSFVGVGYRARIENQKIILRLGFSHEISLSLPEVLSVSVVKRNNIVIKGCSYEKVSQFAHQLRRLRPPEPFKGKGVLLLGEKIRRKEGKKKKI